METKMKSLGKIGLVSTILTVGGCASNEELFAKYDAYCQGATCEVIEPEIIYREVEVQIAATTMAWEQAVFFGYDRSILETKERVRLDNNLLVLNSDESLKISLQAFTDSVASAYYNIALAQRRQNAVVNYLVSEGLSEDRIVAGAIGESMPILPSDSANDRIINRRVEMMLLDGSGRPLSFGIVFPETPENFVPPFPAEKIIE